MRRRGNQQVDWRPALLPYVGYAQVFTCPMRRRPFSSELNSRPGGLEIGLIADPRSYVVLYDAGRRTTPGRGPHDGRDAFLTVQSVGGLTVGRDAIAGRLHFRP